MTFNWQDRGLILDVNKVRLNGNKMDFTQGPQVISIKNKLRVFFSTRSYDAHALPISVVAYCDFSLDFQRQLSAPTLIEMSGPATGGFDEHGIFPFHAYALNDSVIMALTCGWKRMKTVDIDMSIGQAISLDGHHFARKGLGPIFSSTPSEPFLIGDPFVFKFGDQFLMYYIFGTKWDFNKGNCERVYKIGVATSADGINFNRIFPGRQIIQDILPNEAQAMPTVIEYHGILYMFYCYRNVHSFRSGGENAYRINFATSKDGLEWNFANRTIEFEFPIWASEMQCYPNAFRQGNQLFLLYNGNQFGKYGIGLMSTILEG
jgi:hypothetical protein